MQKSKTLADKTLSYWKLSRSYHDRDKAAITFAKATSIVNGILKTTKPSMKLYRVTIAMHSDMIYTPESNTQTTA